jgi:catechol-2,3-dioxygenase
MPASRGRVPDRAVSTQPRHEPLPRVVRGICELTLETSDLAALARFYRVAFECDVISRQPDRVWLACGEHARLGIWAPGEKEFNDRGGRHVHFALSVGPGELTALWERLDQMQIGYRGPVEHPGGDRSLYVEDPEGNVVEVWDFFEHGEGARDGVRALA